MNDVLSWECRDKLSNGGSNARLELPVTAMQQIADWLKNLGMAEYAERFAENRIDFSVLPDLTDHDLEKLGVLLGDRRKMLRAIVNLEAAEKSAPALTVAAPASAVPVGLHDTAERRQVTGMSAQGPRRLQDQSHRPRPVSIGSGNAGR